MTEKQKKTKKPIYGMYFPSEFPTMQGRLIQNVSVDILKFIEHHSDLPDEILDAIREYYKPQGRKYIKFCIIKNRQPDQEGNLYFPFINTYTDDK